MTKLTKSAAAVRVAKLHHVINDYRYQYHVHNISTMSESVADGLKHELVQLEEQFPELITDDSPTQRVAGEPLPQFESVAHTRRMLSLNDVFNQEEVQAWTERVKKILLQDNFDYYADVKMDGFAIALWYRDGKLEKALTRGDGFNGEDVTQNVRTIESVPLILRSTPATKELLRGRIEVRGEILMYNKDFAALNDLQAKKGAPLFKNPRNTAAGTIRQLDARLVAERTLHLHVYDVWIHAQDEQLDQDMSYALLSELGFKVNNQSQVLHSVADIMAFADEWQEKRHDLPFGTDGLVVKVNNRALYEQAGIVGKAPRAAIAFKYPAEEVVTKVVDIIISIGRTGAATPVAVLEPVDVDGSTVQHASLHNQDEIARKDIRKGDTVVIFKAGDIIPQVKEVVMALRDGTQKPYDMEAELARHELDFERDESAAVWRATSRNAPSIVKRSLQHFASKQALDIEGLGEKNVALLVDEGLVTNLADIYGLKYEQVVALERFAEVSARKLVDAIAEKKQPDSARFLMGLGIRHVGQQTAIDLMSSFNSIAGLQKAALDEPDALYEVDGIGEVVARSLVQWFADEQNISLLEKFGSFGVVPNVVKKIEGSLSGKSFAITGSLDGMSRDEAAEKIRALGGTFQSSVGKGTTYLVHGTKLGDSKRKKAEKFGTVLMDEAAFFAMINA